MTKAIFLASFHYISFGLGLAALMMRKRFLKQIKLQYPGETPAYSSLFKADTLWGIAAIVLLGTGLYRLFGGVDKPTSFYVKTPFFHIKMTLVLLILLLELYPMVQFIKGRIQLKKGQRPDFSLGQIRSFSLLNSIQFHLYILLPIVASAMARGARF